jgi:hypothetical protein
MGPKKRKISYPDLSKIYERIGSENFQYYFTYERQINLRFVLACPVEKGLKIEAFWLRAWFWPIFYPTLLVLTSK